MASTSKGLGFRTAYGKLLTPKPVLIVSDNLLDGQQYPFLSMMLAGLQRLGYTHFLGNTDCNLDRAQVLEQIERDIKATEGVIIPTYRACESEIKAFIIEAHTQEDLHKTFENWLSTRTDQTSDMTEAGLFHALRQSFNDSPPPKDDSASLISWLEQSVADICKIPRSLSPYTLRFHQTLNEMNFHYSGYRDPVTGDAAFSHVLSSLCFGDVSSHGDDRIKPLFNDIFEQFRRQNNTFVANVNSLMMMYFKKFFEKELKQFLVVFAYNLPPEKPGNFQVPGMYPPAVMSYVERERASMLGKPFDTIVMNGCGHSQEYIANELLGAITSKLTGSPLYQDYAALSRPTPVFFKQSGSKRELTECILEGTSQIDTVKETNTKTMQG